MTIKSFKYLGLFLVCATAFAATGKLQNSDFMTAAQITGAGGTVSQLLNTSKVYDSANGQLLDTTIASKITGPLTGEVTTVGSVATVSNGAVIAKVLTGFVSGGSLPIVATDSILSAFQKIGSNIASGIGFAPFGSSANSSGGSVSSGQITLQPASATQPGGLSTGVQSIAGDKTFTGVVTASRVIASSAGTGAAPSLSVPTGGGNNAGMYFGAGGATLTYNGADIASWIGSIWKFGVPLQMFITTNATNPGMYWINDSTTGFYRSAANQWGWSSSGAQVFNLSSTGADVTGAFSSSGTATLGNIIDSGVTASRPLRVDAAKNVISSLINLADTTNTVSGLLGNANLANPSATVNGVVCTLGGSCTIGASGGGISSIGAIDSQTRSADGLVTASSVLYAQTATAAFPGMVSTSTQTFAGDKTFNGTVNLNTVTPSRFLRATGAKNVTSSLINLANTTNDVSGLLANGNLANPSTTVNGQTCTLGGACTIATGSGTVSSVSVASANGFSGSVANSTTTPVITVSASVTGIVKSNGSAISAAVSGTDYQFPISTSSGSAGQFVTGFTAPNTFTYGTPSGGGGTTVSASNRVYVQNGLGHGATNTKIRTFSNVVDNSGSAYMVYASDTTNGDKVTIQSGGDGLFMTCYGDWRSGAVASTAITVNDSALTTNASNPITFAQGKRALEIGQSNSQQSQSCWAGNLVAGDIVRAHDDGANSATDGRSYFWITRLGATNSEIYLENGNGFGSTNTLIRRYSNSRINTGSNFTTNLGGNDNTNGIEVTLGSAGTYFVCEMDDSTTAGYTFGLTVNDSALSTDINSMTYAQGVRATGINASVANKSMGACFVAPFAANDVIRSKGATGGNPNSTASTSYFFAVKVSGYTDQNVFYMTGNGHASVQTKMRLFSNINAYTQANAIASPSGIMGYEMRPQNVGTYISCYNDRSSAGGLVSLMVNARAPATNASTPLDFSSGMRGYYNQSANNSNSFTCMAQYFNALDFVSPQDDATNDKTDVTIGFSFGRVN